MTMDGTDQPTDSGDDDGMRALVERWLERTERRLKARGRSAPPEPTRGRAAGEATLGRAAGHAIVMAGYLLANNGLTRRARPS